MYGLFVVKKFIPKIFLCISIGIVLSCIIFMHCVVYRNITAYVDIPGPCQYQHSAAIIIAGT